MEEKDPSSIDRLARQSDPGLIREFIDFLRTNKKWWLVPILLGCGLVALFAVVAASPVFPFIYTLF